MIQGGTSATHCFRHCGPRRAVEPTILDLCPALHTLAFNFDWRLESAEGKTHCFIVSCYVVCWLSIFPECHGAVISCTRQQSSSVGLSMFPGTRRMSSTRCVFYVFLRLHTFDDFRCRSRSHSQGDMTQPSNSLATGTSNTLREMTTSLDTARAAP